MSCFHRFFSILTFIFFATDKNFLEASTINLSYKENNAVAIQETSQLEGSYANFGTYPHWCLGNVLKCTSGLTLQFWFRANQANETDDDVVLITNGGNLPFSNGVYFKQSFGDQYEAGLSYRKYQWKVRFRSGADIWTHVRIAWSEISGLHVKINDVLDLKDDSPSNRTYTESEFDTFSDLVVGTRRSGKPIKNLQLFQIKEVIFDSTQNSSQTAFDTLPFLFGCLEEYVPIDNVTIVTGDSNGIHDCRQLCAADNNLAVVKSTSCACVVPGSLQISSNTSCENNWHAYVTTGRNNDKTYSLEVNVNKLQSRQYVKPLETVEVEITPNYCYESVYYIFFGDGASVVTQETQVSHFWTQEGNYTITVESQIGIVKFQTQVTYEIVNVDEGTQPERVQIFTSEPPEALEATFYTHVADNTSSAHCNITFQTNKYTSFAVESYLSNKAFSHKYDHYGEYYANLFCKNNYGSVSSHVNYLSKTRDIPFEYVSTNQNFDIQVSGDKSFISNLQVIRNEEPVALNVAKDTESNQIKVHNTLLKSFENIINLKAGNDVFHKRIYFVENIPQKASIIPDFRVGAWNLTTNVTIQVPKGNHMFLQTSFGLGKQEFFYIYEVETPLNLMFEVTYNEIGYYPIQAVISNDLGKTEVEDLISVEVPLDGISLSVNNITDKTQPVELIVDINIGATGPEKMTFEIDHGDGIIRNYNYRSWTDEFTPYVNEYIYDNWGIYTICVRAFNEIDEIKDCALVQVGQNISYMDVKAENPLRTTTVAYAEFNITYINGTDKMYTVDFGDGTVFVFNDTDMLNGTTATSDKIIEESDYVVEETNDDDVISNNATDDNFTVTTTMATVNFNTNDTMGNGSTLEVVFSTSATMTPFTTAESTDSTGDASSGTDPQAPSRRRRGISNNAIGLPQSTASVFAPGVVTVRHIYTKEAYYRVRSSVKNAFSKAEARLCQRIMVDNTDDSICGPTSVSFVDLPKFNRNKPIVRVRSETISIPVQAISNCAVNTGFKYSWTAEEVKKDRETPVDAICDTELIDSTYNVAPVTLPFGIYKLTVTAAPIGYKRKASQAQIFVQVVPSNPVSELLGDATETMFSDGFVTLDFSNSRDPDLLTFKRRGVEYDFICFTEEDYNEMGPTVMQTFMEDNVTRVLIDDVQYIDSTQNAFRLHDYNNCFNDYVTAVNDIVVTDGRMTVDTKYFRSTTTVFALVTGKDGRTSHTLKTIRMVYGNFDEQMNLLLDAQNLKDTSKALDIVNKIGTGSGPANDTDAQEQQDKLKELALSVVAAVTQYAKDKKDVDRAVSTCGRFTTEAVTDTGREKAASAIASSGSLMTSKFADTQNDQLDGTIGQQLGTLSNVAPTGNVKKTEEIQANRKRRQAMQVQSGGGETTQLGVPEEEPEDPSSYNALVRTGGLWKNEILNSLYDFIFDLNPEFRGAVRTRIDNEKFPKAVLKEEKEELFKRVGLEWDPFDLQNYILNPCESELEASIARTKLADKEVQSGTAGTIGAMAGLVLSNMEEERCRRRRRRREAGLPMNSSEEADEMNWDAGNLKLKIKNMPDGQIGGLNLGKVKAKFRRKRSADECGGEDEGAVGMTEAENEHNPYTFGPNSDRIKSKVKSLDLSEPGVGEIKIDNMDEDMVINITVKGGVPVYNTTIYQESGADVVELLHSITVANNGSSIHFWINPLDDTGDTKFKICLVYNVSTPDPSCIHTAILPHPEDAFPEVMHEPELHDTLRHIYFPPQNVTAINGDYAIVVSLHSTTMHFSSKVTEMTYQYRLWVASCMFWDKASESFLSNGTRVGPHTTFNQTECLTNHLTSFGGDFAVPPNTIDFTNVWAKFKNLNENAAVFSTVVAILGLYVIGLIWARREDKKDILKWGASPLDDNLPTDNYHYQLSVYTGSRKKAATASKISFVISGEENDTGVRRMYDGRREIHTRGSIHNYILSVDSGLGPLTFMRVWHDNKGKGKLRSWFLDQIQVTDLQTGDKYFFLCNRWLAVEEDDGMVDRILPVAGIDDLVAFKQLFSSSAKKKLANDHLWFSVFSRPTRSNFTRCQRISCCVSLLFLTMITNCMFFKSEERTTQTNSLTIGPVSFTLQQVFISFVSTVIVFPPNFVMMTFFRRCRPKKNTTMQVNQQIPKRGKWKNVTTGSQTWGKSFKKSRIQRLKAAVQNLVTAHQRSKYDTAEPDPQDEVPETKIAGIPDSAKPKKRKKKPGTLPHWCIYIAYVVCFFSIVASAFFTILYSMEWGPEKANEWLVTFVMSFFQSVIVVQPIKVVCLVAFIACVLKKPDVEDDTGENLNNVIAAHDEVFLKKDNVSIDEIASRRKMANSEFKPPDMKALEEARQNRLMEMKMEEVMKEICAYLCFVLVLFFLSYQAKDSYSFLFSENLKAEFYSGFDSIKTADHYWAWLESKLIPALYATHYKDGKPIRAWWDKRCIRDLEARRVGLPRLRQLRVKENTCDVYPTFLPLIKHCRDEYGWSDDDTKPYLPRWKVAPKENWTFLEEDQRSPWVYRNSIKLKSAPYVANVATYKGGGYAYLFPRNVTWAIDEIRNLRDQIWLDVYTRGIFLEFSVYNPNINLFASVIMLQEFMPSGGAFPRVEVKVFRLLSYIGGFGVLVLLFEVIYAIFTLYFFVRCIKQVRKIGTKYFRQFWHILEFVLLCFCVAVIAMYIFKQLLTHVTMEALKDPAKADFVNLQSMAMYDEFFGWMIGIVVFLATVQFLKLLQFNKKMNMLGDTVKVATKDLKIFTIAFFLYFFAFTACGYLLFGNDLIDYNGLVSSAEAMFSFTLGSFDFDAMQGVNKVLGPLFFFTFVGIVYVGLMSMFFTIIGDAFTEVKENVANQSNDYEIVDFMWKRLKGIMGLNM